MGYGQEDERLENRREICALAFLVDGGDTEGSEAGGGP